MSAGAADCRGHAFRTAVGWCAVATRGGKVARFVLGARSAASARKDLERTTDVLWKTGPFERKAARAFSDFLAGKTRALAVPIDLAGATDFQRKVYRAARTIGYGRTRSYAWLAAKVAGPGHARAVARALATNPAAPMMKASLRASLPVLRLRPRLRLRLRLELFLRAAMFTQSSSK